MRKISNFNLQKLIYKIRSKSTNIKKLSHIFEMQRNLNENKETKMIEKDSDMA